MSFRIEEKLFVTKNSLIDFKKFIIDKKGKHLYPKRLIKSLYFDNNTYQMYEDSIEGLVPRKKIRIRHYPNDKNIVYYHELKISSEEGRFKKRQIISESEYINKKKNGVFDSQYGLCRPVLFVSYEREYYLVENIRVSIDLDIKYYSSTGDYLGCDNDCAVELKAHYFIDKNVLLNLFPFQRIRFSKYCNGLKRNKSLNLISN